MIKESTHYFAILFMLIFSAFNLNAQITSYPYVADFEYSGGSPDYAGWSSGGNTTWEYANLNNAISYGAASGYYGWITNEYGDYSNNEDGYLYSPAFDFSLLTIPKIEFSLWWYCQNEQDGAVLQYTIDDGLTWANVGAFGDENWFNSDIIDAQPGGQYEGWTGIEDTDWDGNSGSGWEVMKHSLEDLAGQTQVEFRLYFASDSQGTSDGFAFDLVKVYDDALAYIPDVAFEQYLLDNLIDSDGVINGQVHKSDISSINTLNISGYNISDFEGLQHFTALTHFTLINNQTTNFYTIDFGGNLLLEEVLIVNTPKLDNIFSLESENLSSLTVVTYSDTFQGLYLGNLPNLTVLSLAFNSIYSLDLNANTSLTNLSIAGNPLEQIDVSYLSELQILDTYESSIKYLDLTNNTNLTSLDSNDGALLEVKLNNGFNNLLTSVDLSNNPNLTCIQVDDPVYSSSASGWDKDASALYAENCGFPIRDFPYTEDFENGNAGWDVVNVSNSSWELGTPSSSNLNGAASGSYAWVTNATGNHNSNENGWVISPEFNFSSFDGYDQLYVSFDTWYNTEIDGDGVVLQSSIDGGSTWQIVGDLDDEYSINQYTNNSISGNPGGQTLGWSGTSENLFSNGWQRAVFNIGGFAEGSLDGELSVYFRIAFGSNSSIENDGFAFDKISISENSCYAGEDASYTICTLNEDGNYYYRWYLDSYLVDGYNPGTWTSLDGLPFADENENSLNPQEISESGTYRFKFAKSNCDESIIELNIEKKLSAGFASEYFDNNTGEGCSELTFETPEAFQQWAFEKHIADNTNTVDPGGTWSPSSFEGYGYYTYTQPATSTCSETSSTFLYNRQDPIETWEYHDVYENITNLFVFIDDLESTNNKNAKVALVKKKRGRWRSRNTPVDDNGGVDFPNTGTGDYYIIHYLDYIVEDDCGSIESITHYSISVFGFGDGGENGLLSICDVENLTKNDLFNALKGNPSEEGYWIPEITETPSFGEYTYYYQPFQTEENLDFYEKGATVNVQSTSVLELSVFLQGPFNSFTGWMNNTLFKNLLLESTSPYNDALALGFNYDSYAKDIMHIVDWVWVEFRDVNDETNIPLKRSALLKRNGDVVDVDGFKPILLDNIPEGDYNITVSHRNHLGVITANPINISCGTITIDLRYDNSILLEGTNAVKDMDYGEFALFAGDFNGDGQIQNTDKNAVEPLRGISGYNNADIDMNGEVQNTDLNSVLNPNIGKGQQFMSKKLNAKRKSH